MVAKKLIIIPSDIKSVYKFRLLNVSNYFMSYTEQERPIFRLFGFGNAESVNGEICPMNAKRKIAASPSYFTTLNSNITACSYAKGCDRRTIPMKNNAIQLYTAIISIIF